MHANWQKRVVAKLYFYGIELNASQNFKFWFLKLFEELKLEDLTKINEFNKTQVSILWGYFNAGKKVRISFYLLTYRKRFLQTYDFENVVCTILFCNLKICHVFFFEWPSTRPEIDIIANQASEISTDFKSFLCGFSEGFMNAKTREVCTAGPSEAGK